MAAIVQHIQTELERVPISIQIIAGALVLGIVYAVLTGDRPVAGFPIVTVSRRGWQRYLPARFAYLTHGKEILFKGLSEHSGPFQVNSGSGYKIIVPNKYADEVKSSPNLNFNEAFKQDLFPDYPGMDGHKEGLKDDRFIQEVVRVKLTQSLGLVTDDLVDETTEALHDILGESTEWTTKPIKDNITDVVSRLSARVFLGLPLCRDPRWLQISKDYTIDTFTAGRLLRMCPDLLRPILYWFIPTCTRLRKEVADARSMITPEVEKRIKRAQEVLSSGNKAPKASDTIAWMVECAKGREVDYVAAQLSLTTAAIHTTSETTMKCLLQLGNTPEIIEPLRQEMIQVLRAEGWSKMSLYKMKLLDSFLKEVQRTNAMSLTTMNRLVMKPLTLHDGTVLPAGARIMVSDDKIRDGEVFTEPKKFDVARFMRMREQPGEENRHQFVTTHTNHMAFGHGQHACPGRFFASNEIKIALCFLLLKYDVRFVPGEDKPKEVSFETATISLPNLRMQVRRRQEEINLAAPQIVN